MTTSLPAVAAPQRSKSAHSAPIGAENGLFCPGNGPETADFRSNPHPAGPVGTLTVPHARELMRGSAIAPDVALANFASFGPGTALHWEDVREELLAAKLELLAEAGSGQAGDRYQSMLKLRKQYQHLEHGGWLLYGHDPSDLSRKVLLCVKPDQPRQTQDGSTLKYETPPGIRDRVMLLSVPARLAMAIAADSGLEAPADVLADEDGTQGRFWAWVAVEPQLRRYLTEGGKKTAAGLSAGRAVIGAGGCWNFTPKDGEKQRDPRTGEMIRLGKPMLHPDLQGWEWKDCPTAIVFDKPRERGFGAPERKAARRTARLLRQRDAIVRLGVVPGPEKGLDDWLAAGKTFAALERHLREPMNGPAWVKLRRADTVVPAGAFLGQALDVEALAQHRLVAIVAPMGCGKTRLASQLLERHLREGHPILAPTHRTSLGSSACEAVGLPWMAAPGSPERYQGTGLCWDSLRPSSALSIRPDEWNGADGLGAVLFLDEICQGIEHVLFGTGTAVAQHRLETMDAFGDAMRRTRFAYGSDAQLSDPILNLLEALSSDRFHLVKSLHQPMAGRRVTVPAGLDPRAAAEQGRARFLQLVQDRKRAFVVTCAQKANSTNSAQNLARLVQQHWPEARILLVDSENPEAAATLGSNPNQVSADHDLIIASPSITSGVSIDAVGLFDEVLVLAAGGTLAAEHVAQAAARVRDVACPVTIYAPERAPRLRVGSGSIDPNDLLKALRNSERALLADLVAAGGWDSTCTNESPWLRCWLELAAHRNRQANAYSATIASLLETEGWVVDAEEQTVSADLEALAVVATDALMAIADEAQAAEDAAVMVAEPITEAQAQALMKKRSLSPAEKAQLARYRIAQRWGIADDQTITPELMEADRGGLSGRARFGWMVQNIEARQSAAIHDIQVREQLLYKGRVWAVDAVEQMLGHKLRAADGLKLGDWLKREDAFDDTDEALIALQSQAIAHRGDVRQALGLTPGKKPITVLRQLVALAGYRVEGHRLRCCGGKRHWVYRVVPEELPEGIDADQLQRAWRAQLEAPAPAGVSTFFPIS